MTIHTAIDEGPIRPRQLLVGVICLLINILDGFDVMVMAYAAPAIVTDWAIESASLGLLLSAGIIGTTAGTLMLAPLADVIGRRALILIALTLISVTMLWAAFSSSYWELFLARIANGLGIGSMLASVTTITAEYSPNRHRNLAIGLLHGGYLMGAVLGGLIAAVLIPNFGWRAVFFAGGGLGTVMIPLAIFFLPESVQFLAARRGSAALLQINRIMRRLGHQELTEIPCEDTATAKPGRNGVRALFTAQLVGQTFRLWAAFFLAFVSLAFMLTWTPQIVVNAGLPVQRAIYAGSAISLGGMLGSVLLGWLSLKLGLRPLIVGFFLAGAACTTIFGFVPQEVAFLVALGTLMGFFALGGFIGLYMAAIRIYPVLVRGTGIGWAIGAGRVGAIVTPYAAGLLLSEEPSMPLIFFIFSLPLVLAALATASLCDGAQQ